MENALIFKQILPTNAEMYGDQSWEFVFRYLGLKS